MATRSFEHILSFSVVFNALERIKPLVTKLQIRNQDIYTAYHMTDSVLRELKNWKDDIDNEFRHWCDIAVWICKDIGIERSPSTFCEMLEQIQTKCWEWWGNIALQENCCNTILEWHELLAKWETERSKSCGDIYSSTI